MENKDLKTDSEIFVPELKKVRLGDKEIEVGQMTIEQWVKITRQLVGIAKKIIIKLTQDTGGKIDLNRVPYGVIAPYVLEEIEVVIPIVVDCAKIEEDWLRQQTDMKGFTDLIKAIIEENDFKGVIGNFTGLLNAVSQEIPEDKKKEDLEKEST